MAILSLLLGCGGSAPNGEPASPAPRGERTWKQITVTGSYGEFDVAVPVITLSTADDGQGSIVIDSVALAELEKQLTARVAQIARAQAQSLLEDTSETRFIQRNPAPAIKQGLIAAVEFGVTSLEPTAEGKQRITAAARLLQDLPGTINITTIAAGTGRTFFDVANSRARRVYHDLLIAEPRLAEREVILTVRTQAVLIGAPVPDPVVEVYYSSQ